MANKRIQDLEHTTDLTNDDLIPLDTTKKTFATTLKSLTEWLKNTFQTKDNLEQALSDATDKYPSSKVLKDESSRIVSIMDNYVDKTSKQNISGVKTITGDGWNLYMKSNSISYNTAPSSRLNKTIAFVDKNGGNFGAFEITKNPENINNIYFNIFSPKGSWCPIPLGLRATSDGNFGSTAPKCNWDNSIVTTTSHGSNYVRFGNGLQICWSNSPVNQTITLPQAFINNTYRVTFCQTNNAEHNINNTIVDKTTTSFKFNRGYQGDWIAIGWWY